MDSAGGIGFARIRGRSRGPDPRSSWKRTAALDNLTSDVILLTGGGLAVDIIGTFVEAWREAEFACEVAEKLGLCRKVTYAILQKARTLGHELADLEWLPPDEVEAADFLRGFAPETAPDADEEFLRAWRTGKSIWAVALELNKSKRWVCREARRWRRAGVALHNKPLLPSVVMFGVN